MPTSCGTPVNGSLLYEAMNLAVIEEEVVEEVVSMFRRLGKIGAAEEGPTHVSLMFAVPRGKPVEIRAVEIGHQLVQFGPVELRKRAEAEKADPNALDDSR